MKRKNSRSQAGAAPKALTEDPQNTSSWTRNALILFGVVILGLAIYSNTWNIPFHFDDGGQIEANWSIRNLTLTTLPQIWISNSKTRFLPYLSIAMNWLAGGSQVRGYHIFNFGIHALNAFWVYFMISLLLVTPRMRGIYSRKVVFYLAAFSALIFMVHPLQTQAVTYIVQRMASMAAFFYLGAVVLYLKARSGSGVSYYCGAFGMAVGAMLCKENAATLPLAIVLVDFLFFDHKDGKGKALRRLLPFLATLIIVPCLFHLDIERRNVDPGMFIPTETETISRGEYFLTQLNVLCTYLRLFLFPVNQSLNYDYPLSGSLMEPKTFLCALLLSGLVAAGVFFLKRNRLVSFSIFWFFLTLSVESSVIPIRDVIFEHRMYLPLAGIAVILPVAVLFMLKNLSFSIIAGMLVVSVFSGMTYARNNVWRSEYSLWEDVIRKSPNKAGPYNNLGHACLLLGKTKEARAFFKKAIKLDPKCVNAYINMAVLEKKEGKPEEVRKLYEQAILHDPKYLVPRVNLAIFYGERGDLDRSIEMLQEIIRISPGYVPAYDNLGVAYDQKGDSAKAMAYFNKAIEVNPLYAPSFFRLGSVLKFVGNLDGAIRAFEKAMSLDPNYPDPVLGLGDAYLRMGNKKKVEEQIQKLKDMRYPAFARTLEALWGKGPGSLEKDVPLKRPEKGSN